MYYSFTQVLDQNTTYASIDVGIATGSACTHDDSRFQVQNNVFVIPSRTWVNGSSISVAVARKGTSEEAPRVHITVPTGQQGTLGPTILRQALDTSLLTQAALGYQIWHGELDFGVQPTGAVAVYAQIDNEGLEDVLYLSAGVAGW